MADATKEDPKHNAVEAPDKTSDQQVAPYAAGKPSGERQDGAGAAPPRSERNEATPVGATAYARGGARQGQGSDDPFAAHRGEPAGMASGAATGSGSGAGGGGTGEAEDPDPDSKGGGGRED